MVRAKYFRPLIKFFAVARERELHNRIIFSWQPFPLAFSAL
jgi:hypothetical protein